MVKILYSLSTAYGCRIETKGRRHDHSSHAPRRSGNVRESDALAWKCLTMNRDMANIDIPWEVDGMMTAEQSVSAMFPVIQSKKIQHSGTFWTWENKVCNLQLISPTSFSLLTHLLALSLVESCDCA